MITENTLAPLPRSFTWVASLLYVGVLVTGVYYTTAGLCTTNGTVARLFPFIGLIFLLLILEQVAQRLYSPQSSIYLTIGFLLARMALFELVAVADCSGLSRALFPIVPFAAYFSLGKKVSYGLAVFYLCAILVKLSLLAPAWYFNRDYVSELLMFFIGLVFAVSMARVASEAELNRRRAEQYLGDLSISHQKLKIYAEQAVEFAAAEERNRLARDIHDSLGHYLTTVNILLEKAIAFRQRDSGEADRAVLDAKRLTHEALQDVRQSVGTLRHSGEIFSLSTALTELVASLDNGRHPVTLQITGEETNFPKLVLMSLYRVAQEALTNIQKHAAAQHISLRVSLDEFEAKLCVDDDGQGFEMAVLDHLPADRRDKFGLQGVRERVALVGGVVNMNSRPDQGTHLVVTIPKRLPDQL